MRIAACIPRLERQEDRYSCQLSELVTHLDVAHLGQAFVFFAQLCAFNDCHGFLAIASHCRGFSPCGCNSRRLPPVAHRVLRLEAKMLVVV